MKNKNNKNYIKYRTIYTLYIMLPTEQRAERIYNEILEFVESLIGDGVTYSGQLNDLGHQLFGSKFKGVFASNEIPELKNGEHAVLNLDRSDQEGSHWIAISKIDSQLLVYDSYGRSTDSIIPVLSTLNSNRGNGMIIEADRDPEQIDDEYNCGARSISFLALLELWGPQLALLV